MKEYLYELHVYLTLLPQFKDDKTREKDHYNTNVITDEKGLTNEEIKEQLEEFINRLPIKRKLGQTVSHTEVYKVVIGGEEEIVKENVELDLSLELTHYTVS